MSKTAALYTPSPGLNRFNITPGLLFLISSSLEESRINTAENSSVLSPLPLSSEVTTNTHTHRYVSFSLPVYVYIYILINNIQRSDN